MSKSMRLNDTKQWIKNSSYGFPLWIALTSNPDSIRHLRNRFVFISAENFTRENIRRALIGLAEEFDVPDEMSITALSDKQMLMKRIKLLDLACVRNSVPRGGYYRAYYYRSRNGEVTLRYSPDPEKEEDLFIGLKGEDIKPF